MQELPFGCACGSVRGTLHNITARAGNQLQCHCNSCRRAIIWLGQADPGPDGVRYYQTTPSRVSIEAGRETLQAFTWKNPKLLRWYAGCCNTPLFNTLNTPKWAFVSLIADRLDDADALGPCTAHAFVQKPNGKLGHTGSAGFMWGFVRRTAAERLSGSWRKTPFFDETGAPIATPRALAQDERAKAPL